MSFFIDTYQLLEFPTFWKRRSIMFQGKMFSSGARQAAPWISVAVLREHVFVRQMCATQNRGDWFFTSLTCY